MKNDLLLTFLYPYISFMFSVPIQIQWLHLDPNHHVRHSAYYDFAAFARISLMVSLGLDTKVKKELRINPVLFREEAIFKREIVFEDEITCQTSLYKATKDFNRWGYRHDLVKKDGTLAAILYADGAWMNTDLRKITTIPDILAQQFELVPKTDDFCWMEKKVVL
jgi:acyl-CoA thioester hydrolase